MIIFQISKSCKSIYIRISSTSKIRDKVNRIRNNDFPHDLGRSHDPVWAQKTTLADCRRFAVFTSIIVFLRLQYKDLVPAISGLSWLHSSRRLRCYATRGYFVRDLSLSHKPGRNIEIKFFVRSSLLKFTIVI